MSYHEYTVSNWKCDIPTCGETVVAAGDHEADKEKGWTEYVYQGDVKNLCKAHSERLKAFFE